jgi:hypothetical protein
MSEYFLFVFLVLNCIQRYHCFFVSPAQYRQRLQMVIEKSACSAFSEALVRSVGARDLVSLSFSDRKTTKSSASDDNDLESLKSVRGKLVEIKAGLHIQLTYRYSTNDKTFNVDTASNAGGLEGLMVEMVEHYGFRSAMLQTLTEDHELSLKRGGGKFRSVPANAVATAAVTADCDPKDARAVDLAHDRRKNVPIDTGADFLHALKMTSASGRPLRGMSDKIRQIQKFVQIMDGLFRKASLAEVAAPRVVDMGSGMAYLTFATHAHFVKQFPLLRTTGIEVRPNLVESTNIIARALGGAFGGLSFRQGYIEDVLKEGHVEEGERGQEACDVLIALHACDTASDDAIFHGIRSKSRLIVVAPCCHKEVRRQMEAAVGAAAAACKGRGKGAFGGAFEGAFHHGIYRERTAEMGTDTIRALLLEMSGYDTQVFEFVGGEHTAKNVMIAAVRRQEAELGTQEELDRVVVSRRQLRKLAAQLGVVHQRLAGLLGEGTLSASIRSDGATDSPQRTRKLQKIADRKKALDAMEAPPAAHLDDAEVNSVVGEDWRSALGL